MMVLSGTTALIGIWLVASLWSVTPSVVIESSSFSQGGFANGESPGFAQSEQHLVSADQSPPVGLFAENDIRARTPTNVMRWLALQMLWPAGPPSVSIERAPQQHQASAFDIAIRFDRPLHDAPLALWPHALMVGSGSISGVFRIDESGTQWRVTIVPDGRRSVDVRLQSRIPCGYVGATCANDAQTQDGPTHARIAGPEVTARMLDAPEYHRGEERLDFLIELSEPVQTDLRGIRDYAIKVSNGRVIGVGREADRDDLWRVTLEATPRTDMVVSFRPRSGCNRSGDGCGAELGRIKNDLALSVPAARLYLTFDDGPNPVFTPPILDILGRYDARATFFVTGELATSYPQLIERIVSEGHTLANHTWDHVSLDGISEEDFVETITRTQGVLGDHATPCLRPPYYSMDEHTVARAAELGLRVVLGEVRPRDWSQPGAMQIANRIVGGAAPGRVVVLHDGGGDRSQTIEGLEMALAYLESRNYVYEPVCQ